LRDIGFEKGMTFNQIFIFGDSFADNDRLNTYKGGIRDSNLHKVNKNDLSKLWTEKLKNNLNHSEYHNHGQIARGPYHTMNMIKKQTYTEEDLIVAVLSFHDVIDNDRLFEINLKHQNYIHSLKAKTIILHVYYDEILKHEYTFPLSLYDISNYEILSKQEEISKRRWDRRVNHLSWTNHNILCDCILKMLNGFNNFCYDDFNFKFLSLDEAYHSELVENKKGFIYE